MGTTNPQGLNQPTANPSGEADKGILGTVTETAKDLAASAAELAGEAKDRVMSWTSNAVDTVGEAMSDAREYIGEGMHRATELGKDVGAGLTNLIRRYPVPALLIGFGLGLLLARLTRR
jgi:hypothetical protein